MKKKAARAAFHRAPASNPTRSPSLRARPSRLQVQQIVGDVAPLVGRRGVAPAPPDATRPGVPRVGAVVAVPPVRPARSGVGVAPEYAPLSAPSHVPPGVLARAGDAPPAPPRILFANDFAAAERFGVAVPTSVLFGVPAVSLRSARSRRSGGLTRNLLSPAFAGISASRRVGVLSMSPHVMNGESSTPGAGDGVATGPYPYPPFARLDGAGVGSDDIATEPS